LTRLECLRPKRYQRKKNAKTAKAAKLALRPLRSSSVANRYYSGETLHEEAL